MAEHGVETSQLEGSGKDGRILKEDVQQYLERAEAAPEANKEPVEPKKAASETPTKPSAQQAPKPAAATERVADPHERVTERTTRTPMTRIRQRIAERMVQAQQSAAILTTFNEVDMTNAMALRKQYNERFQERYEVKLGFMSIFVKAVVDALQTVPEVNAQIDGNDIVHNHYYDIGVAVSTDRGLVVPVVRDADRLSFADIEVEIARLAKKARDRTITLEDLSGGVFTISNGGVYGNMMSTPILNPPQSGVLGMHAIKKRPVVVDDEVRVRPMMYVAMSYDHRLVDGREAVTFLKRVVECVENPERMMLEV
jgi:2-oxoglutarate dehydrogenase E2 component (dihydrolipoamide succinyltransferase)